MSTPTNDASSPRASSHKPGSPRLQRTSPRNEAITSETFDVGDHDMNPSGIKIGVRYAETGDSQILYFSEGATVEELKRQVMEYAEHGVSSKINSMILLQEDGSSLVKSSTPLSSLPSRTVYMFSKETLLKSFVPSVALEDFKELEIHGERPKTDEEEQREYDEFRKEICERCLSRCQVQIESGTVALRNLFEHSRSVMVAFNKFHSVYYESYSKNAEVLASFEKDLERLGQVPLARMVSGSMSSSLLSKKTMLEALPREKLLKWAEDANRQHKLIEEKDAELTVLARSIDEGCEQTKREWEQLSSQNLAEASKIERALASSGGEISSSLTFTDLLLTQCTNELTTLKQRTTGALFPTLLRAVSLFQSKIQDLSNKAAALKEAVIIQEQKVAQVATVRTLPEAYQAALREADRRRKFALQFSEKVQQLTDYIAKERDKEIEVREQFHKTFGKILPQELVPGLTPWVFPVCEVTQRPIDPVLFANVLESTKDQQIIPKDSRERSESTEDKGELLFEPEALAGEHELSAMEVLELQAEIELLRGQKVEESTWFTKLKDAHEAELDDLKKRIEELEAHLNDRSVQLKEAPSTPAVTDDSATTGDPSPTPSPATNRSNEEEETTRGHELSPPDSKAEEEMKQVEEMENQHAIDSQEGGTAQSQSGSEGVVPAATEKSDALLNTSEELIATAEGQQEIPEVVGESLPTLDELNVTAPEMAQGVKGSRFEGLSESEPDSQDVIASDAEKVVNDSGDTAEPEVESHDVISSEVTQNEDTTSHVLSESKKVTLDALSAEDVHAVANQPTENLLEQDDHVASANEGMSVGAQQAPSMTGSNEEMIDEVAEDVE